nr:MAG TPA: hypothetical protein [Caudoviricetes sp.]
MVELITRDIPFICTVSAPLCWGILLLTKKGKENYG